MAQDGPGGEKTEKPTPQRLKKARREGQIPKTPELGTWAGVAAANVLMPMLVKNAFTQVQALLVQGSSDFARPEVSDVTSLFSRALSAFLSALLPVAVGLMCVGIAASTAQGGIHF